MRLIFAPACATDVIMKSKQIDTSDPMCKIQCTSVKLLIVMNAMHKYITALMNPNIEGKYLKSSINIGVDRFTGRGSLRNVHKVTSRSDTNTITEHGLKM
jgi:hypothetical protein